MNASRFRLAAKNACLASALAVCLAAHGAARADILDYTAFGGNGFSTGGSVNIGGLVGSNGDFSPGGTAAQFDNVSAGGDWLGGSGIRAISGNVIVNGNASVSGSTTITGSLHAGGNVTTFNSATIGGSIFAGGTVTLSGGTTVGGTVNPGATPPALLTHTPVTVPASSVFSAGGPDQTVPGGGSLVLIPGTYGDLDTNINSDLFLSSGTFFFDSVSLGQGTEVFIDLTGGPISIFSVGDFTTGSNVQFFLTALGTDASMIYIESLGDIHSGQGGNLLGTFFAGNGSITTGSNKNLTGAFYASDTVDFGAGNTVNFLLATNLPPQFQPDNGNGNGTTPIPEPTSLAVWGVGMLGFWLGAKRRRRAANASPRRILSTDLAAQPRLHPRRPPATAACITCQFRAMRSR